MAAPGDLLRTPAPWAGRRHRHVARVGPFAHIEVKGLDRPDADAVVEALTAALAATEGVVRVEVNRALSRAVIELQAGASTDASVAAPSTGPTTLPIPVRSCGRPWPSCPT
jgi:hypothetical protein